MRVPPPPPKNNSQVEMGKNSVVRVVFVVVCCCFFPRKTTLKLKWKTNSAVRVVVFSNKNKSRGKLKWTISAMRVFFPFLFREKSQKNKSKNAHSTNFPCQPVSQPASQPASRAARAGHRDGFEAIGQPAAVAQLLLRRGLREGAEDHDARWQWAERQGRAHRHGADLAGPSKIND